MRHIPTIVITGASGLIGRTLLDEWKNDCRIFAIARRSQQECGAPIHPNIAWMRADVSDIERLGEKFREIATAGGADLIFHLAAFYDFSGERHPEYYSTNVIGTRNVLHLAADLNPRLLLFASSVAACEYPPEGDSIDENTPPDGEHIYSWSKREGEKLIRDPKNTVRSCIVRLGAVYTDWCEYPPLYALMLSWLKSNWKSRILAGKGETAIPYIHIRDILGFFTHVIENIDSIPDKSILQACTCGSTSHRELFELATRHYFGEMKRPMFMPVFAARFGLNMLRFLGRITGEIPFEHPWMLSHVDRRLNVDASRTYRLLNWSPNPRHALERRIRYLIAHFKTEPLVWHSTNLRASRKERERPELRIYHMLAMLEETVSEAALVSLLLRNDQHTGRLRAMERNETLWFTRMLYRLLLTSIHSGNTMLLRNYFEISSEGRIAAGYGTDELIAILSALNEAILLNAAGWDEPRPSKTTLHHCITTPIEFAIDEIEFQRESGMAIHGTGERSGGETAETDDARKQLEETIWNCLVQRR